MVVPGGVVAKAPATVGGRYNGTAPEAWLLAGVYDGDRFQETDPAALALVTGDDEAEGALVRTQVFAVDGIGDENRFGGEVGVEFGQGKRGTVCVAAFGYDAERHALAAKVAGLRHASFGEQ